jgi:lipopolysaccharide transport protein LptA
VRAPLLAVLLALLAPGLAPAATPVPTEAPVSIGVAPFAAAADAGAVLPDLASLLADRLGALDRVEVVGPSAWGASAAIDPSAEQIRRWAQKAGVEAVVVGRTTGAPGEPVRLSVTLYSGATGGAGGTRVVEIPEAGETRPAIERLAASLADDAAQLVSSPPPAELAQTPAGDAPFGISIDSSQPLAIRSDELEASQHNGARHLVFRKNVEATQADVTIRARELQAFYPPEAKQPARLIATGDVVLTKHGREARCDEATYDRVARKLTCTGHAELHDGEDQVAGDRIEFDLASEAVTVSGAAAVRFHPHGDDAPAEAAR